MVRRHRQHLAAVLALVGLVGGACSSGTTPAPTSQPEPGESGEPLTPAAAPEGIVATVVRVDDGDSLVVRINREQRDVRLIGVNAPERGECLSEDARDELSRLIDGRDIVLETGAEPEDRFNRILAYAWVDGTHVNAWMVAQGLAIARAFPPNITRQTELESAEAAAHEMQVGVWDPAACGDTIGGDLHIVDLVADPRGRDSENLNGEFAVVENRGEAVDMSGYVLRDGSSVNRYEFPAGFVLGSGATVAVLVGCGTNTGNELHWCADGPVWDNHGDQAFLTAPNGGFVATFEYGSDE